MMAALRRYGPKGLMALMTGALLVIAILIPWLADTRVQQRAQAQEASGVPSRMVDLEVYTHVQRLREALCLTNQDLAALGLTEAQAEGVLASLRSWVEVNGQRLELADAAARGRERELRDAMRRVHVGPRDESLLRQVPRLREARQEAEAGRERLLDEAAAPIASVLSGTQRGMWEAARLNTGRGVSGFYRYVADLGDGEVADLGRALRRKARGLSVSGSERLLLEMPAVEQAKRNQSIHLPGVLLAEQRVLPLPDGLKEPARDELRLPRE